MGLYLVRLDPRSSHGGALYRQPVPPICKACAAGYHEQLLLVHERCECPCHGTASECAAYGVAA
jgi:hypothetical protein